MNGIDWEARTGKPIEKIDIDDKITVMVSILDEVREAVKPIKGTCETVRKHTTYWKVLIFFGVVFATALVSKIVGLI